MDREWRRVVVIVGCGLMGILLAFLELTLYNRGVILDEYVTGTITIQEVMSLTITIWLLGGVVLAATRS